MNEHLENVRRTAERGLDTFQHILDELERYKPEPSIPISQLQKLEAEWREEADRLLSKAGSIYMQALNSDNHQAAMSSRHYRNRADQLAELIHKNK